MRPSDGQTHLTFVPYKLDMTLSMTNTSTDEIVQAAADSALHACNAAITVLGRALADLRDTLPGDLRADGERAFSTAESSTGRRPDR